MDNYMLFTILTIVVIILIYLFNKHYAFGIVEGFSMMPEFKHRELFFVRRKCSLKEGKVYLINMEDFVVIKRLKHVGINQRTAEVKLWFLGDNLNDSIDSRHYGWIEKDKVIGEVYHIWRNKNERNSNT